MQYASICMKVIESYYKTASLYFSSFIPLWCVQVISCIMLYKGTPLLWIAKANRSTVKNICIEALFMQIRNLQVRMTWKMDMCLHVQDLTYRISTKVVIFQNPFKFIEWADLSLSALFWIENKSLLTNFEGPAIDIIV